MSERSKETDSKSVMWFCCIEGSNPSLSEITVLWLLTGEVSEWSKVHDWKSCKVKSLRGFESPPLRNHNRC